MRDAIVVLGCAVRTDPRSALDRRVRAAAEAFASDAARVVVASGGRAWNGVVEADHMCARLVALGVPRDAIAVERCSHSTRENAVYSARILAARGAVEATIVSCAWHLPRALDAFRAEGIVATAHPAHEPFSASWVTRGRRRVREWVARRLDGAMS